VLAIVRSSRRRNNLFISGSSSTGFAVIFHRTAVIKRNQVVPGKVARCTRNLGLKGALQSVRVQRSRPTRLEEIRKLLDKPQMDSETRRQLEELAAEFEERVAAYDSRTRPPSGH
jgi:hypothetical protein